MNDIQEVAEATSALDQLKPLARSKRDFSPSQIDGPKAELREGDGRMWVELPSGAQLVSTAASEKGLRKANEDAVYQTILGNPENPIGAVFVLADGMGGENRGSEAARNAVQQAGEKVQAIDFTQIPQEERAKAIRQAIVEASRGVEENTGLENTTIVVGVVVEDKLYTFGNGDSRIYIKLKKDEVWRATTDYSMTEWNIRKGNIPPGKIYEDSLRDTLTAWFEPNSIEEVPCRTWDLDQIEAFLLCSDGVWAGGDPPQHDFNLFIYGEESFRSETGGDQPDGGWIGEAMAEDPVTAAQELTSPDVQEITGDNASGIIVSVKAP